MRTRREQLRPEVRARTILAACASAYLTPLGDVPADAGCCGHLGVLLDPAGAAYLLVAPGGRSPEGRFRISCRAGVPGLGVLRLEGTCGADVCPTLRPEIEELLSRSAPRSASPTSLPQDDLRIVRVSLDAVTVLTPATDTRRAGVSPVSLDAFASAGPDAWLLDAESARELLEREHQQDLRSLARSHADAETATSLAVSVRAIAPRHLDLACLSLDGVTSLTIAFDDALEHPGHVRRWVAEAARRVA